MFVLQDNQKIMASVNLLGVLAGAVVAMVIGGLWYGPLFGKMWTAEMHFTPESMAEAKARGMTKLYVGQFVFSLVGAYVLAHFMILLGVTTVSGVCSLAFWLWLGFQVPIFVGATLWEGKSMKLFVLNAFQNLVALIAIGIVLVLIG
jgi:hypothetical protein